MKKTLLAILFLSSLVIAEQNSNDMQRGMGQGMGQGQGQGMGRGNGVSFEERKAKILAFMEENYNGRVTCVKAAKNEEDMKQCRKQAQEKMQQQREQFQAKRKGNQ